MEQDTRKLLFERLEQSLLDHARTLIGKEGGPYISDIYKLAGLSDRYYYLSTEHQFTPAEIDALLLFEDPLDVVDACWEESNHDGTFSICEVLDEIEAYDCFPMTVPLSKQIEELKTRMGQNYTEFTASLMGMSKTELVEHSLEIASMRCAYAFMVDKFSFEAVEVNNLLKLRNPLRFLANNWLLPSDEPGLVHDFLADLNSPEFVKKYVEAAPAQHGKTSILEQLRNAVQAGSQRPSADHRPHGNEPR